MPVSPGLINELIDHIKYSQMITKPISKSMLFLLLLQIASLHTNISDAIDLRPNCGFPGRPYRSTMMPSEKSTFSEGDTVSYECIDYWAPPQTRRCERGQWVGPMARCADSVTDVKVRDAQCFDLTTKAPLPVFRYTKMILHEVEWKYPTVFVAKAFQDGKLFVNKDHEYSWEFNLTRPSIKLYVKVNFLFLNFTNLPDAVQSAHRLDLQVDISPYRTCVMEYQSLNSWQVTGNRIDTYFICESRSHADAKEEQKYPPDYLKVKSRSSHSIPHVFSALMFGKVYGTEDSPICGEPERFVGESIKTNRENRDYVIECGDRKYWGEGLPTGRVKGIPHLQRCLGDMRWNGTRPICLPIRHCPLDGPVFDKLKQEIRSKNESTDYSNVAPRKDANKANSNNGKNVNGVRSPVSPPSTSTSSGKSQQRLIVDSLVNYFHAIDGKIYATYDSEITYACDSEDFILVGRESRKCRDGKWSGVEPTCKNISPKQLIFVILGLVALLAVLLGISGLIFYRHNQKMKSRVKQAEIDGANAVLSNDYNILNKLETDDGIYELYDRIDEGGNEYAGGNSFKQRKNNNYNKYSAPDVGGQYYDRFQTGNDLQADESDYVQMYRRTPEASYEPIAPVVSKPKRPPPRPNMNQITPKSFQHQDDDEEGDYLDLSGVRNNR